MVYTPGRRPTHCTFCGAQFTDDTGWPRDCPSCGETTWVNPLPVAVVLLPVRDETGAVNLIVERRTIFPGMAELALPGGYIEAGETWKQAAVRELREETVIEARADEITLFDVDDGATTLQVFAILPERHVSTLPEPIATKESEGWLLLAEPVDLAFPTHTAAVAKFFTTAPRD